MPEPEPKADKGSRGNEVAAAIPGLIVGIVTAAISDLSAPVRLVVAALLGVVYWSWPWLATIRRRPVPQPVPASTASPPAGAQPVAESGEERRLPPGPRPRRSPTPLAVALAVAIVLNVLALVVAGVSLAVVGFVVGWLLALALPLRLAQLSEPLRSALYQAAAVSVGAALTIGGQPVVQAVTQPDGTVFWHAGWRVSLDRASLASEQAAAGKLRLAIPAVCENLGDKTAAFASPLVVSSQGRHYTEPGPGQDLPTVPGRARQAGTIAFTVDPSFRLDDAVLTVGQADHAQAVVPLGRSGTLVSLAPRPIRVSGKAVGNTHVFTRQHGSG